MPMYDIEFESEWPDYDEDGNQVGWYWLPQEVARGGVAGLAQRAALAPRQVAQKMAKTLKYVGTKSTQVLRRDGD